MCGYFIMNAKYGNRIKDRPYSCRKARGESTSVHVDRVSMCFEFSSHRKNTSIHRCIINLQLRGAHKVQQAEGFLLIGTTVAFRVHSYDNRGSLR